MKLRLLLFLSVLCAFCGQDAFSQATVTFSMQNIISIPSNRKITLATASGGAFTVGSHMVFGATEIQPTNGIAVVTNLTGLVYTMTIDGVSGSFRLDVPDDTNSYSAVDLIRRGLTLSTPQLHIAAAEGVQITTNNSLGIYTVTISQTPTNVTAIGLTAPFDISDIQVRATNGWLDLSGFGSGIIGNLFSGSGQFLTNIQHSNVTGLGTAASSNSAAFQPANLNLTNLAGFSAGAMSYLTQVAASNLANTVFFSTTNLANHTGVTVTNNLFRFWSNNAVLAEFNAGALRSILGATNNVAVGAYGNSTNGLAFSDGVNTNVVIIINVGIPSLAISNGNDYQLQSGGHVYFGPNNDKFFFLSDGHSGGAEFGLIWPRIGFFPANGNGAVGAAQFGSTWLNANDGSHALWYWNASKWGDASDPLGYSYSLSFDAAYWNGATMAKSPFNFRVEAVDTNRTTRMRFYTPTYNNWQAENSSPALNEFPGPSPFEIISGTNANTLGLMPHGFVSRDVVNQSLSGTNYGINADGTNLITLNVSANLNLTNIPSVIGRTNQGDETHLRIYPGLGSYALSTPTNWSWESEIGTNTAPTNIPAGKITHITISPWVSGSTNYVAHVRYAPYPVTIDTNAQNFFTAAATLNSVESNTINQFVISAKTKGYWSNLLFFHPHFGGTSNSCSWNLVDTNKYRLGWTGSSSTNFTALGVYGDGTTFYADTGLTPSGTVTSPNSMMIGVWLRAGTPNDSRFMGCGNNGGSSTRADIQKTGGNFICNGLNLFSAANTVNATGGNWTGFFGVNRTSSTSETPYINGVVQTPGSVTATTLPTTHMLIWARNDDGTPGAFSTANLAGDGMAQNMTPQNMTDLITDWTALNAGR